MNDYNKTLRDKKLKKYKLTDLVANGSRARLKVDSDLLVGESSNGDFAYGDILDANATDQLIQQKISESIEGQSSSYQARVEDDVLILS